MEGYSFFLKSSNSSLKAAFTTTAVDYKAIKTGFPYVPKIIKEELNFAPFAICTDHDNFFADLNAKISNDLISFGIVQYWFNYFLDFEMKPVLQQPKEPKVFDIGDLKFGFIIWLWTCVISFAVFMTEVCYWYAKRAAIKVVRACIGLLYFVRFFRNLYL